MKGVHWRADLIRGIATALRARANIPNDLTESSRPQSMPFISTRVVTTGGMAMPRQEGNEVVKNQPYQAQAVTEVKQTLADGCILRKR
jgi:hypothetical protein